MEARLPGLTGQYSTILADPPWQFQNRTGKVAPEHRRLNRIPGARPQRRRGAGPDLISGR